MAPHEPDGGSPEVPPSVRTALPDRETLARFYVFGWERRWLARLDDRGIPGDAGYKLRLRNTLALLRPPPGPFRLLDVGCGVGIYAAQIARRFPRARILGIDLSPAHVEAARSLAARLGVSDRVGFQVGDALALEVTEPPHVILAAEVIEHLVDPLPCLVRLAHLVAPGGQVLLSVPQKLPHEPEGPWIYHRRPTGGNYDSLEDTDRARLGEGSEVYTYYHRHYRSEELDDLLRGAGLVIRRRRVCFWQRPPHRADAVSRWLDYCNQRSAIPALDQVLIRLDGPEYAHNLIRDCAPAGAVP